jgi:hypothetical protein
MGHHDIKLKHYPSSGMYVYYTLIIMSDNVVPENRNNIMHGVQKIQG